MPLHVVSSHTLQKDQEVEGNSEVNQARVRKMLLIKMAVLGDVILRGKKLERKHIRDVSKLLGQIVMFSELSAF